MKERLEDELERLGQRPDELADVYQNMARCMSEVKCVCACVCVCVYLWVCACVCVCVCVSADMRYCHHR